MRINILTGTKELAYALRRFLAYVFKIEPQKINILLLGKAFFLSQEMINADFWLIEAFNPKEPNNPEGFRAAKALAGEIKCLLFFLFVPEGFPEEGSFWCNPLNVYLKDKINKVIRSAPPSKNDFDKLVTLWPELIYEPEDHHHHSYGREK